MFIWCRVFWRWLQFWHWAEWKHVQPEGFCWAQWGELGTWIFCLSPVTGKKCWGMRITTTNRRMGLFSRRVQAALVALQVRRTQGIVAVENGSTVSFCSPTAPPVELCPLVTKPQRDRDARFCHGSRSVWIMLGHALCQPYLSARDRAPGGVSALPPWSP